MSRVGTQRHRPKKLIISQDLSIPFLLSEVYEVVNLLNFYPRLFHVQSIWLFMIESLQLKFLFVFFYNFYLYTVHLDIIKVSCLPTDALYISLRKH